MLLSFVLILLSTLSSAIIMRQCQCDDYMKCRQSFKRTTLGSCVRKCFATYNPEGEGGSAECFKRFDFIHRRTLHCVNATLGSGCTTNPYHVVRQLEDSKMANSASDMLDSVTKALGFTIHHRTETATQLNGCMLRCFLPIQTQCTKRLNCGVFFPPEPISLGVVMDCAADSQISPDEWKFLNECTGKNVLFPKKEQKQVEIENFIRKMSR